MAEPLLQAQIDIDAPVDEGMAADHRPQADARVEPPVPDDEAARAGPSGHPDHQSEPAQPAVLDDHEHHHRGRAGKKFAFRVNTNNTIWSYELEPTETGTRLVESRHAENGVKPVSNLTVKRSAACPNFERELVEGMNASLARLKSAAEKP